MKPSTRTPGARRNRRRQPNFAPLFAVSLSALALNLPRPAAAQDLAQGFANPPQSAQPQTWWHWLNGNVTHAGITADLEAMKRVGVGGAEIFNVDQGIPAGDAPFLSPKWFDMVHFAESEANRLGLELCIHNCAGWSSSGGPWITPEYAMQEVVTSATNVTGGTHVSVQLAQPPTKYSFYRDIAVIAVPSRPGGSTESDIADLRAKDAMDRPNNLGPATTSKAPRANWVPIAGEIDLTGSLNSDGTLAWDAPAGNWTILRIGYTPTGAQNEPSPPAGLGLECDKLSKKALDVHFAGMVQKVLDAAGPLAGKGKTLNDVLIDSYEVGSQNWTPEFREEFRKRRGYDLLPYLPILAGRVIENPTVSERFLWDFRRTITDLFTENYYGHFAELCHKRGLKFSCEAYGNGPFDELACGGAADIPMAEFWVGGAAEETAKLASSSGHTYGRTLIGAESFTSEPSHEKGTVAPYDLKAEGDQMYCAGINRFIFHRYAMQPWTDRAPGMTMGPWGIHFERTQTWWNQGAAWLHYLARCQYLLQQGTFVADAAYFNGDNGPIDYLQGDPTLPDGYDYDSISRELLLNQMTVDHGMIALPSGMRYHVLILPRSQTMTVETLQKIRKLVNDGATVVGPRPGGSPSLQNYPQCDADVTALADELWGPIDGNTVTEHSLGRGRVVWSGKPDALADVFASQHVAPDFGAIQTSGDASRAARGISFIHRNVDSNDVYFVASRWNTGRDITASFRQGGDKTPYLWHPDTGEMEPAPLFTKNANSTFVSLHLEPSGSVFVVFRDASKSEAKVDHAISSPATLAAVSSSGTHPTLTIEKAVYEAADGANGSADVTARVASEVQDGTLEMSAGNGSLGGDPASNHVKRLVVNYTLNGTPGTVTVPENGMLEILNPESSDSAPGIRFRETSDHGVLTAEAWQTGDIAVPMASGTTRKAAVTVPAPITLDGSWALHFPPNLGAPDSATLPALASWTDNADAGVKYFSGTATYTKTIEIPGVLLGAGKGLYLDLGQVKNLAQVRLNGVDLGVLWKPPFRVDISAVAHAGTNNLEVAVTNLWPNRLIGDEQLPDDAEWHDGHLTSWPQWLLDDKPSPSGRIAFTTWKHWSKTDPLLPSGLLGPVRLLPSVIVEVK